MKTSKVKEGLPTLKKKIVVETADYIYKDNQTNGYSKIIFYNIIGFNLIAKC